MASNGHDRGSSDESDIASHSIPLQDLSGPEERSGRGIGRVGSRLFSGRSLTERGRPYERLTEDSPVERAGATAQPRPPDGANQFSVDDPGAFAAAMSSVGLGFHSSPSTSHLRGHGRNESESDMDFVRIDDFDPNEAETYLSPSETFPDTTPLTSIRHVQPISGASAAPSASGSRDDRSKSPSVRFDESHLGPRLGDDLHNMESGHSGRRRGESVSRDRSLSPSVSGSALQRASSMMKSVSQRVVNLSNEPEIVEQSILREESHKSARMEAPPSLPSLPDYASDAPPAAPLDERTPREKSADRKAWRGLGNPLKGKALGILGPDNAIRTRLCDILVHPFTEPFILVVIVIQTILLTIESAQSEWEQPRSTRWGTTWMDFCYFAIFIIYTAELIAKIMVSGLFFNPTEYSTIDRSKGLKKALAEKGKNLITPQRQFSTKASSTQPEIHQTSILRTFTGGLNQMEQQLADDPLQKRRIRLAHRAFLRHSFNRLDFVAVVSYWVSFMLAIVGLEAPHQIFVFRMLSCLRILRLLALTSGTSVILRSLKKAAPLLVHVAFLIGFFWLLFAIVGIQSFKSSFRRTCVWDGTSFGVDNFTSNDPSGTLQFCGGYLDQNYEQQPWIKRDGNVSDSKPKGFICPVGSYCVEGDNPYNKTMSFDDILHSLELVFVIMSSNTFTDLLYNTTDSDYLVAALFFACGFVILSLWMVNLLVAVITHSFQVIREESKRSAFASQNIEGDEEEDESSRKLSNLKRFYDKTYWFWIAVIVFDLVMQALRSSSMGPDRRQLIDVCETIVTFVLLAEIILRFVTDWRKFHQPRRNWVDLGLVIITCIIQIPAIKNSGRPYSVLTLFQILRVYRVVLAFSVTRTLITLVFRNAVGLINLIIFVFLITFLASIFATQLFRSQIPREDDDGGLIDITFADIYNSFLGMYQILSSENWTGVLYNVTSYTYDFNTAWISATFVVLWFVLANFIILNMFIAVIQESFDVSEDEKRLHQVRAFLEQKQVNGASQGNLSLSKILKIGRRTSRFKDPLDHGPAALDMLLKDAVVREFLDEEMPSENQRREDGPLERSATTGEGLVQPGAISRAWTTVTTSVMRREPNPFYSKLKISGAYEELGPQGMAKEVVTAAEQRKRAQREYLIRHPNYNKSLFLFKPDDRIRRLCQCIVGPGRGHQRVEGVDPFKPVWYTFSAFVYAAIVAMVILACITTPIYQSENFQTNRDWFTYTDLGFAILFTIEAIIKVIADGFFWTPNAYFRGSWGFIDGIVLVTLWVNVLSTLTSDRGVSRAIGAFKALRALRLLNFSDSAKNTFHSVIIVGGWKVIAAALVSMSFLIPFAIYGVNLFAGQLVECNDDNFEGALSACVGEFMSSPYDWEVLAPRVASNPFYDFDNFGNSLFILFQIVSQEGWTDVQAKAMAITGVGQQPESFAAPENGLFFIVFNLLGAVFVLTLFVSVFMRNYTEQTGVAFLTAEQRSWLELRKLLRQVSPSKRRSTEKTTSWKQWCYRVAYKKHGRWARTVTTILVLHLVLLIIEFYPENATWDLIRDAIFFAFNFFYAGNVILRLFGLGWQRFRRSSWDLYALFVVPGTIVTSILNFTSSGTQAIVVLSKLFLVAITLLLIPRNNQLDQLFKTAAASLTSIGNLLATWFVLFLVYAIAMNQAFGLTKFGANENGNINFRDIPRALILLFRLSCGEGWNELMEDFAGMEPPFCTDGDISNFANDCGSKGWARALFISWNIISMYIFVSLFVSLIFESFSYVYQRSSGLYVISREEIRRFKQAWAEFDPEGTGYISKEHFPRLLRELTGVFEVRIYQGEFMVPRILDECRVDKRDSLLAHRRVVEGVDLDKLARIIRKIPLNTVRERRKRLNEFYEEILVSADPVLGISFHSCLMILAHYNVISDSKSLKLEEFLRRRAKLQRVEEAVRRNTVIGFFKTLTAAREFRRKIDQKRSARMTFVPQFNVPEIYVDDEPQQDQSEDHPNTGQDGTSPAQEWSMLSPSRSEAGPSQLPRLDTSVAGRPNPEERSPSEWSNISISLSPNRDRANTTGSYDPGPERPTFEPPRSADHSRNNSAMSVNDVMASLGDSAWGESIRRSFTQRRRSRDET
ncbi:Ion transport protein-domain-containing protein [Aspergillus pseudodeflectus]|uniref:Ion transport protein-domain-containing protein n=1 Tax=Aspergillus pseudodeflectus TaxID=176178 RepID=A0ABR4L2C2_9EURO